MTNPIKLKPWFVFNKRIVICQTHPELDYPIKNTLQNGSESNSGHKIFHGLGELSFTTMLFWSQYRSQTNWRPDSVRSLFWIQLCSSFKSIWTGKEEQPQTPAALFSTCWQYCGHCCLKVNKKLFSLHFCSSPVNFCFAVFVLNLESSNRDVVLSFQF